MVEEIKGGKMKKLIESSVFVHQLDKIFREQIGRMDRIVRAERLRGINVVFEVHVSLGEDHNPICSVIKESNLFSNKG